MLGNSPEKENSAQLSFARSYLADARDFIYRSFLCAAFRNGVEKKPHHSFFIANPRLSVCAGNFCVFRTASAPNIFSAGWNERQRCRFVSVLYRKNCGQTTDVLRSAKCFSLVSDARRCVASASLRNGKRNEI
jgi:hypothetical protein